MGASVSAAGTCAESKAPKPSLIILNSNPLNPDDETGKVSAPPNYGFEGKERKERVPPVTKEELRSAKVPPKYRDFCAHKLIAYRKCNKDNFPYVLKCAHQRHEYMECQYEDYIVRMKEYERERRLLHRKARKEAAAQRQAKHDEE